LASGSAGQQQSPLPSSSPAGSINLAVNYRPLDALVPYAQNARRHSPSQITKIKASLMEFGWANPMLIASDQMIAGHARLTAALELRREGKIIPHIADGTLGPTIDLSHLTPRQRRAYILADNRLAEEAIWDLDLLRLEVTDLGADGFDLALAGFGAEELTTIMRGWQPDYPMHDGVEAALDPLMAMLRLKCQKVDVAAITQAIRTALQGFDYTLD
jgi:hypothetical protein